MGFDFFLFLCKMLAPPVGCILRLLIIKSHISKKLSGMLALNINRAATILIFRWSPSILRPEPARGQSYKTFYTLGQIYKFVLKLDNMLSLRKYLVRILGHYSLHRVTFMIEAQSAI